jgi:uncharacterized protein
MCTRRRRTKSCLSENAPAGLTPPREPDSTPLLPPLKNSPPRRASEGVALFTRYPVAGQSKTRLVPLLGERGAAGIQAALIRDTLRKLDRLPPRVARYVFVTGSRPRARTFSRLERKLEDGLASTRHDPDAFTVLRQRGADLGERLERAFRGLLRRHERVVVIGSDSPTLPVRTLRLALNELRTSDGVLGPCPDGGYYLIGLRRLAPPLFRGIRWGSRFAFRDTLRNLIRARFCCSILEPLTDIDRPADVQRLATELSHDPSLRRQAPAVWRFLREQRKTKEIKTTS